MLTPKALVVESLFQYDESLGYKKSTTLTRNPTKAQELLLSAVGNSQTNGTMTQSESSTHQPRSPNYNCYFYKDELPLLKTINVKRRFIVYLEPNSNSKLAKSIKEFYRLSKIRFGPNEAHLYHPHCSMTGFISVSQSEVPQLIAGIHKVLNSWLQKGAKFPSPKVEGIAIPKAGNKNIVLKLESPQFYHAMIKNLVEDLDEVVKVRSKRLDHVSLAYLNKHVNTALNFSDTELNSILTVAKASVDLSELKDSSLAWDIAFYEQTYQSFNLHRPHKFTQLGRWSLN